MHIVTVVAMLVMRATNRILTPEAIAIILRALSLDAGTIESEKKLYAYMHIS